MRRDDYEIELTPEAEDAYQNYYRRARPHIQAGNTSNGHVKTLRMIDEVLDKIIPADPFHHSRALSGALSSIYRVKKGRLRICYTGTPEIRRVVVLYIAESLRKDGDKNDPYKVLTKLFASGKLDQFLPTPDPPSTAEEEADTDRD